MFNILVIEDSYEMVEIIRNILGDSVNVNCAASVNNARDLLSNNIYDLFLVDINLPDGNGFEICSFIRNDDKHSATPIIFLTGETSEQSQILGFSLGADDYLTKPINPSLFKVRILSRLKKQEEQNKFHTLIRFGKIKMNSYSQQVFVEVEDNKFNKVDLTQIEYKFLNLFINNQNLIFSRNKLIDEVWGQKTYINDRVVDQHISSLRKKIGDSSKKLRTIRGIGYKMESAQ